jgi:hypothetical protein
MIADEWRIERTRAPPICDHASAQTSVDMLADVLIARGVVRVIDFQPEGWVDVTDFPYA